MSRTFRLTCLLLVSTACVLPLSATRTACPSNGCEQLSAQQNTLTDFQKIGANWIEKGFMHGVNLFNDRHPTARYAARRNLSSAEEIKKAIQADRKSFLNNTTDTDIDNAANTIFQHMQDWIKDNNNHQHQYSTRNTLINKVFACLKADEKHKTNITTLDSLLATSPTKLSQDKQKELAAAKTDLEKAFPHLMGLESKTRARANTRHNPNAIDAWKDYNDLLEGLKNLQVDWIKGATKKQGGDGFLRWHFGDTKVPAIGYIFSEIQQQHLTPADSLIATYVMVNCTKDQGIQNAYANFLEKHSDSVDVIIQDTLKEVSHASEVKSLHQAITLAVKKGLLSAYFTTNELPEQRAQNSYRESDACWKDALKTFTYDKGNEKLFGSREQQGRAFKNAIKNSVDTTDATGGTAFLKEALFKGDMHPRDALGMLLRQAFINGDGSLVVSLFQRFPERVQAILVVSNEPVPLDTHIKLEETSSIASNITSSYVPKEISNAIQQDDTLVAGPDAVAARLGVEGMLPRAVWCTPEGQNLLQKLKAMFSDMPTSKGPGLWTKALLSHQPTPDQAIMCLVLSALSTHAPHVIDALEINDTVKKLAPDACNFITGPIDQFKKDNKQLIETLQSATIKSNEADLISAHNDFKKKAEAFQAQHKETIDNIIDAPVHQMFDNITQALHSTYPLPARQCKTDDGKVEDAFVQQWVDVWEDKKQSALGNWQSVDNAFYTDLMRCFYLYGNRNGGSERETQITNKSVSPQKALAWLVAAVMPYFKDAEVCPARLPRLLWFYEKHKEAIKSLGNPQTTNRPQQMDNPNKSKTTDQDVPGIKRMRLDDNNTHNPSPPLSNKSTPDAQENNALTPKKKAWQAFQESKKGKFWPAAMKGDQESNKQRGKEIVQFYRTYAQGEQKKLAIAQDIQSAADFANIGTLNVSGRTRDVVLSVTPIELAKFEQALSQQDLSQKPVDPKENDANNIPDPKGFETHREARDAFIALFKSLPSASKTKWQKLAASDFGVNSMGTLKTEDYMRFKTKLLAAH